MHPGEDLLDFSEPKKANFNMGGGCHWDTLQTYLTNGFRRKLIFPTNLGSISFLGRVKVEVMFLDPFLGHEVDVDVDALERLLFDFIFT